MQECSLAERRSLSAAVSTNRNDHSLVERFTEVSLRSLQQSFSTYSAVVEQRPIRRDNGPQERMCAEELLKDAN